MYHSILFLPLLLGELLEYAGFLDLHLNWLSLLSGKGSDGKQVRPILKKPAHLFAFLYDDAALFFSFFNPVCDRIGH